MTTISREAGSAANTRQAARWNGPEGQMWVEEQARFDRMCEPIDTALFAAAALQPGERVLDVGCGADTTTLAAAWEVAPSGSVTGVDISDPLVSAARDWTAGWSLVELVVADAQTYRLPSPCDVAISRNGLMLFDDPAVAFETLAANVRPGGRVAFSAWAEAEANAWSAIPNAAAAAHIRMPAGPPDGPCAFSFADPSRVRALLAGAGFADVTIRRLDTDLWVASDVSDAVGFYSRSAPLPEDVKTRILATLRVLLAPYSRPDGVWLPSATWIVTATRTAASCTG